MEKSEQIKSIIRGYSALANLPDADSYLEVAVKHIKSLFENEEVKSLEERKSEFYDEVKQLVKEDRSNVDEVTKFYYYWIEHPEKITVRTKMKWEKERDRGAFNVKQRYATWERQSKKFAITSMLSRSKK